MKSLKLKFIAYTIPLIVLISLSFLFFFVYRSRTLLEQRLTETGFSFSEHLAFSCELGVLAGDKNLIEASVMGMFKEEDVVSIAVYNQNGEILTSKEKTRLDQKMPGSVLKTITTKKTSLKTISYTQDGEEVYNFFSPIIMSGMLLPKPKDEPQKIVGFTKMGFSLKRIEEQNKITFLIGLGMGVLIIFLGISGIIFLVGRITKPLRILTAGVEAIGKGDLDYRIKITTGDEIEELGKTFNQMTEELKKSQAALEESRTVLEIKVQARTKELQELAGGLEQKVKDRTKELQERVSELERFHRLTVGRELKMVELKREIEKLKGRE